MNQVHVPFVAWLSKSYREEYPKRNALLNANIHRLISTSRSFAPTALDMAGIRTDKGNVDKSASLLSTSYNPREPLYLSDHNKAVNLQDIL